MIELELNFRAKGNSEPYVREGFASPEPVGTWMTGPVSRIVIPGPPRADGPFSMELSLVGPALRAGLVDQQRLTVTVNNLQVFSGQITRAQQINCNIPAGVVAAGQPIHIMLAHPDAFSPSQFDGQQDRRELAICLWGLVLIGAIAGEVEREPQAASAEAPVFQIRPRGNLGNRMFQYMVARRMQALVPTLAIAGVELDDWDTRIGEAGSEWSDLLIEAENIIEWQTLPAALQTGRLGKVAFRGVGLRMENLPPLEVCRTMFPSPSRQIQSFDERFLIINIRTGDIFANANPLYPVIPINFYADLIQASGLLPVFVGQLEPNAYVQELRARFPTATFLPRQSPIEDFETIRRSKNIVIAVSTFSWLAAWLSMADRIYLPVAGFYNPQIRSDIDLLPAADPRYKFYEFPAGFVGTGSDYREVHAAIDGRWTEMTLERGSPAQSNQPGTDDIAKVEEPEHAPAYERSRGYVDLTGLANHYGSDKGTNVGNRHGYTQFYQFLFEAFRLEEFSFLELGLLRGGPETGSMDRAASEAPSVRMWLDFFPRAICHGFDISDFSAIRLDRFHFHRGDLSSTDDLARLRAALPALRFVVDDASHASYHQQLAFATLFPLVEPGGYYIIEDLDWQPQSYETKLPRCRLTRDMMLDFATSRQLDINFLPENSRRMLASRIGQVHMHRQRGDGALKLVAIQKTI